MTRPVAVPGFLSHEAIHSPGCTYAEGSTFQECVKRRALFDGGAGVEQVICTDLQKNREDVHLRRWNANGLQDLCDFVH